MKLLIDIKDNKAPFVIELLNSLPFVKIQTLTEPKALLIKEINEAVDEMRLIKAGKKEARNADDFLNEL